LRDKSGVEVPDDHINDWLLLPSREDCRDRPIRNSRPFDPGRAEFKTHRTSLQTLKAKSCGGRVDMSDDLQSKNVRKALAGTPTSPDLSG
jgi:hypothetical protein